MADVFQDHRQLKHEEMRKKLWVAVCSEVSGAYNCNSSNVAVSWADKALKAFDERFPAPATISETFEHPLVD